MRAKKTFIDDNGRNCTGCNTYKTWDQFSKRKRKGNSVAYTSKCKTCLQHAQNEIRRKKNLADETKTDPSGICFDLANQFILGRFKKHSGAEK